MAQKRWSLSVPLEGFSLTEHVEIAREAEQAGYTDAWSMEVDGVDCFAPLATLAQATDLRLGTALANVYTRGPATLAMSAAGLAELAPNRFCLGIGAGSHPIVEFWNGGKFAHPAVRVREMLAFLRQAFSGERITFEGETFTVKGFRFSRPPQNPIPIHVGALKPMMLRIAGQYADGAIINWLSATDVKKSVAVVREAAQAAGRSPDEVEITARIFISVDPPGQAVETGIRRHINTYLNVPVYKAFHQWLGRTDLLGPMWEAWAGGDRKAAVAAVPPEVMQDLFIQGSPEEMRARVRRYLDNGVDTVFLQMQSFETDPAIKRANILNALHSLTPGA